MERNSIEHLMSRIDAIEKHIINLIIPFQEIDRLTYILKKPLQLESSNVQIALGNILKQMEKFFDKIKETTQTLNSLETLPAIQKCQKEISDEIKNINLKQAFAEIKYIGNRLKSIEESIAEIKETGIKKQIQLDFTCDGYEMVKMQSKKDNTYGVKETEKNSDANIKLLLDTLLIKESIVLCKRLGLLGEKKSTFVSIGKDLKLTGGRVGMIYRKALRKCRHPSKSHLVDKIAHVALLKELRGQ